MAKILITGSQGQLGRAIVNELETNEKYNIIKTDLVHSCDDIGQIVELDITDKTMVEKVILNYKPDIIINCAAHTAVDLCETDKENAYRINVEGPINLAIVAEKISAKLVHISTDYVFDGTSTIPYTEDMQPNPQSYYAYTKYQSEIYVRKYCSKSFIIRTAWMYGEGKNFVRTMLKLAENNKQIKVVNDQYGTPTSAKEVAKMIVYLMDTDKYGLYHGTCEGSTNWYGFAKEIFRLSKLDVEVIPISSAAYPSVAKRPAYAVLENKKLKEETDYRFSDWHEAIAEYLK